MKKAARSAPKVYHRFDVEYKTTSRRLLKNKKERDTFIEQHIDEVFELGRIGCTINEVLAVIGISEEFFSETPLKQAYETGLQNSKTTVRRKLFQLIDEDCVPAIIYACKTILKLREYDPILDSVDEIAKRNTFKLVYNTGSHYQLTKEIKAREMESEEDDD